MSSDLSLEDDPFHPFHRGYPESLVGGWGSPFSFNLFFIL